jgi:hypothetical protein
MDSSTASPAILLKTKQPYAPSKPFFTFAQNRRLTDLQRQGICFDVKKRVCDWSAAGQIEN